MLSLSTLAWATVVAALISFWWQSDKIKNQALSFVYQHCKRQNLQLLDQTMVLKGLNLHRNEQGSLQLQRRYSFEFTSTGEERYQGSVSLAGRQLLRIDLDAHILPESMDS